MDNIYLKRKYNISVWVDYRLNYWAIPKCANTAVKLALKNKNYKENDSKWAYNPTKILYVDRDTALSNDNKNFTVVRHPYDRFISLYKDRGLRRPLFKRGLTFDDFLDKILEEQYDDSNCYRHIRSMTSYICDDNKNILVDDVIQLDQAKNYLNSLNLTFRIVNKTDNLEIDLTDKQKEKIYNRYKNDFVILGYKE